MSNLLYDDRPLFGLDISDTKVRVIQLLADKPTARVIGYGETSFDGSAIKDGVIEKPEIIAKAVQSLFQHNLIGSISSHRVAIALPIARAFTRTIDVPGLNEKEVAEAIQNESAQYIPASADELYIDYTRVNAADGRTSAFIVAMPRTIVDSYITLGRLLGLEVIMLQTASGASAHLFARDTQSDVPTVLVGLSTESADITVYDGGPIVTGTVAAGLRHMTDAIAKELHVTQKEAELIAAKYGLSYNKKQTQIQSALSPTLTLLTKEIKRTIRYAEEHSAGKRAIAQVILTGEGANMPGLSEHLTDTLRVAVRALDPTPYIDFGKLQPFSAAERMSYATAIGLASIDPRSVFA